MGLEEAGGVGVGLGVLAGLGVPMEPGLSVGEGVGVGNSIFEPVNGIDIGFING